MITNTMNLNDIKEIITQNDIKQIGANLRDKIFAIETAMKKAPQLDLEVLHHFSDGIYARELVILKDTIIVGKIHKYRSLNILLKGELSVLIDSEVKRIRAPTITVAPPGMKRIAYAYEDSIWLTVHGTNETDLAKIEDHFIAQSETEWLEFCKREPMLPLEDNFDLKALQELRKGGKY